MACKAEGIDLNRALPKLPAYDQSKVSFHSSPSKHHQSPPQNSMTGGFAQSSPSASSKRHLQAVTQRLLSQASPEDMHYSQANIDPVEPIKFSPSDDSKVNRTMTAA